MFDYLDRFFKTLEIPFVWMDKKIVQPILKPIARVIPCIGTWAFIICIGIIPIVGQVVVLMWVALGMPGAMPEDHEGQKTGEQLDKEFGEMIQSSSNDLAKSSTNV